MQTLAQPTTAEIVARAKSLLADGLTDHDIAELLGIDVAFIRRMRFISCSQMSRLSMTARLHFKGCIGSELIEEIFRALPLEDMRQ